MTGESEIGNFYKNQTIFITGGTGFLGKILVEKLLRLCEIKKIYILVRPKKGKTIEERFEDFFNYACFDRVKTETNHLKDKVFFINGDCEAHHLGISTEDQEVLINESTIVIHAAANVKFDQPLQTAAKINVRSTKDLLEMVKLMPNLQAFVYVSTAYSNCVHSHIDEQFYDPPMTATNLLNIVNGVDKDVLENITPILLKKWPNTYTFTKTIAEDVIKNESQNLPIAIVRPAIVTSTMEEPVPGWIDNFYGVGGIVVGAALGALRSLNARLDSNAYVVPCDYVANNILAAIWALHKERENHIPIYNYVGSNQSLITWRKFMQGIEDCAWDYPTKKQVWYYSFKIRENRLWHNICIFFLHTVLAYIVDFIFICTGRKAIAVKNYDRINKLLSLTSYFSLNLWTFNHKNVDKLWSKMTELDRKLYPFNMDNVDWDIYARNSVMGGRIYLLKDPLETLPEGKKRLKVLRIAHYTSLTLLSLLIFLLIKWIVCLF